MVRRLRAGPTTSATAEVLELRFDDHDSLRRAGFTGFESVDSLRATRLASGPEEPGVYLVVRPTMSAPRDACVIYIGKAGGPGSRATLRSRLRAYLRQGLGHNAGHAGGRRIWQLADSGALLFAWRLEREPRTVERLLIESFEAIYGRRPFANRRA